MSTLHWALLLLLFFHRSSLLLCLLYSCVVSYTVSLRYTLLQSKRVVDLREGVLGGVCCPGDVDAVGVLPVSVDVVVVMDVETDALAATTRSFSSHRCL
jgi:hypothetical protein